MPPLKNRRHEKFAKEYIEKDFNGTQAYLETYPKAAYSTAMTNASDLLRNTQVVERIDEVANKKGLTVDFEVDRLLAKHEAQRPIVLDGEIVDYPDHAVQMEAIKTGLKLHGFLNSSNTVNNIDARSVNISLDSADVKRMEDVALMMQGLRARLKADLGGTPGGG